MGFDRTFFRNIGELLEEYYKLYPCETVTLTLRVVDREFDVIKIINSDNSLLTFAYFSEEKSVPASQESGCETPAYPALTVPYGAILWVEFNPGRAAKDRGIGFTVPKQA